MTNCVWKTIEAQEYCYKVADGTHDSPKRKEAGRPLITSKHIKGRAIDFETAYLISENDYNKINQRSKVDQWDVLISMIGEYCGYCYVEPNQQVEYAVKNVGIFKTGDKTKAYWLYYYLNSPDGKEKLKSLRSGTSQPYISLGALRTLPVVVPEMEEMKRIVDILSSIDEKIELNRQTAQTLEAIAQAIFKEWFVDFNFPGATGEMQESELGEIPKGWSVGKLFDTCRLVGGGTPKTSMNEYWENGTIPWISAKDVTPNNGTFIIETEKKITRLGLQKSSAKLLPSHATVITARGTVGNYCMIPEPMAISQSNYALVPIEEGNEYFLFYTVASLVTELKQRSYGTVFDTITTNSLADISIIIPTRKIFQKFHLIIHPIFENILGHIQQTKTLTQLRGNLLPKLMKGEIQVQN